MNALLPLLSLIVRHGLMLCGGFFAAHGIDGSSTIGMVTGLLMLGVVTAWSLAEKWLNLKPGQLTDNTMLRSIAGAVASQLVTALSAYFATDANNPELLGVAALNVGLSKLGVHQKLAAIGAKEVVRLCILSLLSVSLVSCSTFTKEDAKAAGAQIGLAAADAAIVIARMQLASAESELALAAAQPGADQRVIVAKQLAVIAARQALDQAQKAIARQRVKLDAKQPRDVQPEVGKAGALPSLIDPSGSNAGDCAQQLERLLPTAPLSTADAHGAQGDPATGFSHYPVKQARRVDLPHYGTQLAAQLAAR